ncbi:hypothetical protein AB205_0116170 [Aquarana catesbeiana]|uniref:Uncharacterized protein n=1 Tax=Aquarana catesbeiana TaxID=8400 RepID=A0A2G9SH94_AQUCT|nr:hypothetical protein AB205_0116170 [Aquarana catesbeiana]
MTGTERPRLGTVVEGDRPRSGHCYYSDRCRFQGSLWLFCSCLALTPFTECVCLMNTKHSLIGQGGDLDVIDPRLHLIKSENAVFSF